MFPKSEAILFHLFKALFEIASAAIIRECLAMTVAKECAGMHRNDGLYDGSVIASNRNVSEMAKRSYNGYSKYWVRLLRTRIHSDASQ
jgi:hypothetical protein